MVADAVPANTTYVAGSTTLNGAAVADVANGQRRLYVYDNTGTLLTSASVNATWPATAFDDGDASIGGTQPTSFQDRRAA